MAASSIKILMIVTSQATMGTSNHPTGVWLEELTTPYYAFSDQNVEVDIASIQGGQIPVDPNSEQPFGKNPASVERFLKDPVAIAKVKSSLKIDQLSAQSYDAIFLPGGHGTMWDLPTSQPLAHLLSSAWQQGKVLAAVCHGPVGLINVKDSSGQAVVKNRHVSAFSNTEEVAAGLDKTVPFLLEDRLRELGAIYEKGSDFQVHAVRDGRLVTGQNPQSSEKVAQLTLQAVADLSK